MCIGEPLARTEGVLILAEIMRRYKLSRASDRPVGINARVTLRPAQPIMLAAQPRPYDAPQYAASQYTTSKSNL
jgi:cytochrome P450